MPNPLVEEEVEFTISLVSRSPVYAQIRVWHQVI
jgi:hypothetical protein